jgi:hypothetical protein
MKRRRLFIIISASTFAIILAVILWPGEREPQYNGIPLSKWLARYVDNKPQSAEAIKHIGTNALPFLLRWIQFETPGWRTSLNHLGARLPSSVQKTRALHWLLDDGAQRRAELAVEAFWALGPKANPASDELLRLALTENPRAPNTQRRATEALMNMAQARPAPQFFDNLRVR